MPSHIPRDAYAQRFCIWESRYSLFYLALAQNEEKILIAVTL